MVFFLMLLPQDYYTRNLRERNFHSVGSHHYIIHIEVLCGIWGNCSLRFNGLCGRNLTIVCKILWVGPYTKHSSYCEVIQGQGYQYIFNHAWGCWAHWLLPLKWFFQAWWLFQCKQEFISIQYNYILYPLLCFSGYNMS